jgi:hypothetical protein
MTNHQDDGEGDDDSSDCTHTVVNKQVSTDTCVEQNPSIASSGLFTNFVGLTTSLPGDLTNPAAYADGTAGLAVAAVPTGYPTAWDVPQAAPSITEGSGIWVSNDSDQPTNGGSGAGKNGLVDVWRLFTHQFTIPADASATLTTGTLHFAADNGVVAFLDGTQIGSTTSFSSVTDSAPQTLTTGAHTLKFSVKNDAFTGDFNPTGLIYNFDFKYCGSETTQGGDGGGNTGGNLKIAGKVYHDNNSHDGGYDEGSEDGLSTWKVYLDTNDNAVLDGDEASKDTDSSGNYEFTGLTAGCYIVREVEQGGWVRTEPSTSDVYHVGIGGAICEGAPMIDAMNSESHWFDKFFKTAQAATIYKNFPGDAIALNFGNITDLENGGGSNGGSGGGSRGSGSSTTGQVLGDSTNVPSGQVLGDSTTLPVTGSPAWVLLLIALLAAPMYYFRSLAVKNSEDSN